MAANRRRQGSILAVLWVVYIVLLIVAYMAFNNTRLSHRSGFPYMPLYGAMTWWFFFAIPLIGTTYGFLNDWKDKDDRGK